MNEAEQAQEICKEEGFLFICFLNKHMPVVILSYCKFCAVFL